MNFLEDSLLVAAHPDDEILWFGGVVADVGDVVTVFEDFWPDPAIGPARREALEVFPRKIRSLGIAESASYGCADWTAPVCTEHGLALNAKFGGRNMKQRLMYARGKAPDPIREDGYARTARQIEQRLRPLLRGKRNVFTHNPWGEYGHEDHVQVFRVLDRLRTEIGFKLWMSNYCTERALPFACTYFGNAAGQSLRRKPNLAFIEEAVDAYKRTDCWTWDDDWVWFPEETYVEAPREQKVGRPQDWLMPLNFFTIDTPKVSVPPRIEERVGGARGYDLGDTLFPGGSKRPGMETAPQI